MLARTTVLVHDLDRPGCAVPVDVPCKPGPKCLDYGVDAWAAARVPLIGTSRAIAPRRVRAALASGEAMEYLVPFRRRWGAWCYQGFRVADIGGTRLGQILDRLWRDKRSGERDTLDALEAHPEVAPSSAGVV